MQVVQSESEVSFHLMWISVLVHVFPLSVLKLKFEAGMEEQEEDLHSLI